MESLWHYSPWRYCRSSQRKYSSGPHPACFWGETCRWGACRDLHYYVVVGAAAHKGRKADEGAKATEIDLLHSITGAFRPGVLTALMVRAGAVKSC